MPRRWWYHLGDGSTTVTPFQGAFDGSTIGAGDILRRFAGSSSIGYQELTLSGVYQKVISISLGVYWKDARVRRKIN
ncbi:hypothetical protein GW17_00040895 [Ensete ventricosum]|nr:hypothetical protein GW17_00040895 [Ensete ventricosum]